MLTEKFKSQIELQHLSRVHLFPAQVFATVYHEGSNHLLHCLHEQLAQAGDKHRRLDVLQALPALGKLTRQQISSLLENDVINRRMLVEQRKS